MKKKKSTTKGKLLKIAAVFLAVNFLTTTLIPTIGYALTSGPTAPEYTSFEPVDTTDMVNLATGDLTYNIPLLEVPGPEGGYPLALSYHAGISPDEEASWVGLGWTLNAGAINRFVNAYPDDYKGSSELIHDHWDGGSTSTFSAGIGIGLSVGIAKVGGEVGLTFGNDTYKGSGVGANVGVNAGIGLGKNVGLNVGVFAGAGPFGGEYMGVSASAGVSMGAMSAGVSVGAMISTGQEPSTFAGAGVGVSYGGGQNHLSLLSASISSNDSKPSYSAVGINASLSTSNNSHVTQSSSSLSISFPVWFGIFISLGGSHTRYYIDQLDMTSMYGSLYPKAMSTFADDKTSTFDCFSLKSQDANYSTYADSDLGGSLPAYDAYTVLGQGIGGAIQPYIFETGSMYRKITFEDNKFILVSFEKNLIPFARKVGFRFTNDFSNSFTRDIEGITQNATVTDDVVSALTSDQSASIGIDKKGYLDNSVTDFNKDNGMLAGSKHIEWFSNGEIEQATAPQDLTGGETNAQYLSRLSALHGFVPNIDDWSPYFTSLNNYSANVSDNIGGFMITNPSGVSYHYSIPVYNFENYDEYTDNTQGTYSRKISRNLPYAYSWLLTGLTGPDYVDRAPYGIMDENDWGYWVKFEYGKWTDKYSWRSPESGYTQDINGGKIYSSGKKELYYLDAIKTRSHTALFVKDIRRDAKGVTTQEAGGFAASPFLDETLQPVSGPYLAAPAASLKLNSILLYTNRSLAKAMADNYNASQYGGAVSTVKGMKQKGGQLLHDLQISATATTPLHLGNNVLDESDLSAATGEIKKAAVRQIVFNYDHSLCPGTPNSADIEYSDATRPILNQNSGKLTLKSVGMLGISGSTIMPLTSFGYSTNNPGYDKTSADIWGMYNSAHDDYNQRINQSGNAAFLTNNAFARKSLTSSSKNYVDSWSLTSINSPLGAQVQIAYESDVYMPPVLNAYKNFVANSMTPVSPTYNTTNSEVRIKLVSLENLSAIPELQPGKTVHLRWLVKKSIQMGIGGPSVLYGVSADPDGICKGDFIIKAVYADEIAIDLPAYCNAIQNNGFIFVTANVIADQVSNIPVYGGGLRVKEVSVLADNAKQTTSYQYDNGITAYDYVNVNTNILPDALLKKNYVLSITDGNTPIPYSIQGNLESNYNNAVYSFAKTTIHNTYFLPPPGVLYPKVTISSSMTQNVGASNQVVIPGPEYSQFEFSTFNTSLMPSANGVSKSLDAGTTTFSQILFKDKRQQIGLLKRVAHYNAANNQVIKEVVNQYLHETNSANYDDVLKNKFKSQGRIDQAYVEYRRVTTLPNPQVQQLLVTEVEEYPVIPTLQTEYDGKTGTKKYFKNLAYDFYSGESVASWNKDAYGNQFVSQTVPAYTQYPAMGMRIKDSFNKHMLIQGAAAYAYKVTSSGIPVNMDDLTKVGIVAAAVSTWSNGIGSVYTTSTEGTGITYQGSVWRSQASYSWTGDDNVPLNDDGTHTLSGFTTFNFANLAANDAKWLKGGEMTLVDVYSHPLEMRDINGNYVASLYDPLSKFQVASAVGASYNEIAYSGCEFNESYIPAYGIQEGKVKTGNGIIVSDNDRSHTGHYSLKVNKNDEGFTYSFTPVQDRKYRASVWLYLPGSAEGAGNAQADNAKLVCRNKQTKQIIPGIEAVRNTSKKARSFYLISLDIDANKIKTVLGNLPEMEIVCLSNNADRSIYFDDFRFHPLEADFTSYVYDLDRTTLTHILDGNNLYTRFEYDNAGKLTRTYQELFRVTEKLVGEQKYNYGKLQN